MSAGKCDWCSAPITKDDVWPVMNGWKQIGVACCSACQEELELAERDRVEYEYECGVGPYWSDFE
jgi:hypothetical protein